MSAFITLAEKARREGGNGKLILHIEVMAIYYESYYCLSHRITSLESLLSFVLRDSPCPREPSQPSQAPSASGGDTQTPQGTAPVGLRQRKGGRAGPPAQPRSSQPLLMCPTGCFKGVGGPRERSRSCSDPAGTSLNQKKGKRMEPPAPPLSLILLPGGPLPHLLVRDKARSVSAVSMKEK